MNTGHDDEPTGLSRRDLVSATGLGLAALSIGACATPGASSAAAGARDPARAPRPPFDSMRDYVAALEAHGLLLRFPRMDQDAFHATALVYRLNDRYGMYHVPAVWFDEVKVGGRWMRGPVLGLLQGNLHSDAIVFGEEVDVAVPARGFRATKARMADLLQRHKGVYPEIPPVPVTADRAPCKQVILRGDAIDLTAFPFLQTNPTDAGRYVNTASVFTADPEMGVNFGIYRCQLKGPRLLGVNPEPGQTGWKMLEAAKQRGDRSMAVSLVLGQDPVMWVVSSTRVANRFSGRPVDELAVTGGLRGRALEIIRSETNDLMIPAHAEMVIEGEIPLDEPLLPEGPFGEMFGYMGPAKGGNYWMRVTCVTHRRDPWFVNAFTGMQRGMCMAPQDALSEFFVRRSVANLVELYQPQDTPGVAILSIDKSAPGQGLAAGRGIAQRNPIAKVVIVVDKDIDVMDRTQVMFALGSRWQPHPGAEILAEAMGLITDPSQVVQGRTSKIVIDATRQWPGEGGRERFPETNRALLERGAPQALGEIERLYGAALRDWGRG